MKLIIDIPYFVYNHIKEFNSTQLYELNVMMAIQKGLLLENAMEQAKIEELEKIKTEIEELANDEWNIQVGVSKGLECAVDIIDYYISKNERRVNNNE